VEPDIIDPGTRTTVFIGSTYLVPDNSTATIGSWALLDANATSTCGLTGATDPDMEPGTYDVTIEAPDGTSRVLEDGFTVGEELEGCGCSAGTASSALWWAPLLGLGVLVRRRDD
jgi:MYXO-CTERM domain-containing protein